MHGVYTFNLQKNLTLSFYIVMWSGIDLKLTILILPLKRSCGILGAERCDRWGLCKSCYSTRTKPFQAGYPPPPCSSSSTHWLHLSGGMKDREQRAFYCDFRDCRDPRFNYLHCTFTLNDTTCYHQSNPSADELSRLANTTFASSDKYYFFGIF